MSQELLTMSWLQTSHGDQHVLPIQDITFAQPVPQSAIFPPSLGAPPASREEANESPAPTSLPRTAEPPSAASKGRMLSQLRIIDYRYYRLLLHPDTNLWRMVRDWRDPVWAVAGVKALRRGPDAQVREQRQKLFGRNMISIEAKSVLELLLDECLHPFCASDPPQLYRLRADDMSSFPCDTRLLPSGVHRPVVSGRLYVLCRHHFHHQRHQHCLDAH